MSENIQQAINEVMRAVGYVPQTGKIQGYSYTSESDLIEALRPAMNEAGVICMPRSIVEMRQETYTTKGGSVMNRVTLLIQYAFVHAASGTELLCQTVGEGSDAGDKATAKAMTGALKYALRQTFLIETGDDPDKAASVEQERASSNGKHSTTEDAAAPQGPRVTVHNAPKDFPPRPWEAEVCAGFIRAKAEKSATRLSGPASEQQVTKLIIPIDAEFAESATQRTDRLAVLSYVVERPLTSSKELSKSEASAIIGWQTSAPPEVIAGELNRLLRAALKDQGQIEMELDADDVEVPAA
jgi:hypothetical protein